MMLIITAEAAAETAVEAATEVAILLHCLK
jgi:hypothetical protein